MRMSLKGPHCIKVALLRVVLPRPLKAKVEPTRIDKSTKKNGLSFYHEIEALCKNIWIIRIFFLKHLSAI